MAQKKTPAQRAASSEFIERIREAVAAMRAAGINTFYIYVHRSRLREIITHPRIVAEIADDKGLDVVAFVGANLIEVDALRITPEPILWDGPIATRGE